MYHSSSPTVESKKKTLPSQNCHHCCTYCTVPVRSRMSAGFGKRCNYKITVKRYPRPVETNLPSCAAVRFDYGQLGMERRWLLLNWYTCTGSWFRIQEVENSWAAVNNRKYVLQISISAKQTTQRAINCLKAARRQSLGSPPQTTKALSNSSKAKLGNIIIQSFCQLWWAIQALPTSFKYTRKSPSCRRISCWHVFP